MARSLESKPKIKTICVCLVSDERSTERADHLKPPKIHQSASVMELSPECDSLTGNPVVPPPVCWKKKSDSIAKKASLVNRKVARPISY